MNLQELADNHKKIDPLDYSSLVESWNNYQKMLEEIRIKAQLKNSRLRNTIKSSYRELRFKQACIAICALGPALWLYGMIMDISSVPVAFGDFPKFTLLQITEMVTLAFWTVFLLYLSMDRANLFSLPNNISFKCKPTLFIDDRLFANEQILGLSRTSHDPKVHLPIIEMQLPRDWIAQNSLLIFMGGKNTKN